MPIMNPASFPFLEKQFMGEHYWQDMPKTGISSGHHWVSMEVMYATSERVLVFKSSTKWWLLETLVLFTLGNEILYAFKLEMRFMSKDCIRLCLQMLT